MLCKTRREINEFTNEQYNTLLINSFSHFWNFVFKSDFAFFDCCKNVLFQIILFTSFKIVFVLTRAPKNELWLNSKHYFIMVKVISSLIPRPMPIAVRIVFIENIGKNIITLLLHYQASQMVTVFLLMFVNICQCLSIIDKHCCANSCF